MPTPVVEYEVDMSSQQFADLLLAQWWELWLSPPAERMKIIEETRLDYEYFEDLQRVEKEMGYEL